MSWAVEKEWVSKEGLRCVITRGGFNYHRCGYVAVTKDHPLYGVDYSAPTPVLKKMWGKVKDGEIGKRGAIPCLLIDDDEDPRPDVVFDVHGSLTFSGEGKQKDGSYYPVPGDDLWWFGFDCAHYMDDHEGGQPLGYVVAECESLAEQLMRVWGEAAMWTHFMDMHSGGDLKEQWQHIFIEAPMKEAGVVFYNRFGHNPHRITCTCCGPDYSISEADSLEQATGYERHCDWEGNKYVERPSKSKYARNYRTLPEYLASGGCLVIRDADIKPEERTGEVPEEGWYWHG